MNNYLGVMLDCSRNAVMKPKRLKEFIQLIKKMGYNTLMLYTEDTYEIEDEPLFGYLRGRYTIEELQDIDSYCKDNGVELIPCIQTLAHLGLIFKFGHYASIRDCMDVLLVDEEKTYDLIDKMFQSLSKAFTSKRVHIGMDEAHWLGRGTHIDKYGYEQAKDLLLRHLNKVVSIAEKYGFKPMIWSDMFVPVYKEFEITEEVKKNVPSQASLVYWNYYSHTEDKYIKDIDNHLQFERELWFAGGAWKWHGFHAGNQKSIDTMTPAISVCREKGIKNVLITMWGDDGNECPAMAVLPALLYIAELYNGNYDLHSIKEKFQELVGESWDEFMQLDLPMKDFHKGETFANGSKAMLYSDPFYGFFDNTVTEREGRAFADMAEKLSLCKSKHGKYAYIFESMERFARLVAVKYELGYWTRKHYVEGNKDKLRELLAVYDNVVVLAEDYLDKFEEMWHIDNKPNGFEVHEIRIGGMIERVKRCRKRLEKYLCGNLERIEELEEKLVETEETKQGLPCWNLYKDTVTVNLF